MSLLQEMVSSHHCQRFFTEEAGPRVPLFVPDQLSCPSLMQKCNWVLLSGGLGRRPVRNTYHISPNRALEEGYAQLQIGDKQRVGSTTLNWGNQIQNTPVCGLLWTRREELFHFKAVREQILYTNSSYWKPRPIPQSYRNVPVSALRCFF